jgi:hypothetical protein
MHDLNERFRIADEIRTPDLWSSIETRATQDEALADQRHSLGGGRRRLIAGVTAFVVFAIVAGFSWKSLRSPRTAISTAHLATYTDKLGWNIDYPAGWVVRTFIDRSSRFPQRGVAFSNAPLLRTTTGYPGLPFGGRFDRAVALIVTGGDGGLVAEGGPYPRDSSFPLSPSDAKIVPGDEALSAVLPFQGNAVQYTAVFGGGKDASQVNRRAVEAAIRSIRFPSVATGSASNGWTSVGSLVNYPAGLGTPGVVGQTLYYVMRSTSGFNYVFVLPAGGCPEPEGNDATWDPARSQVWIRCANPPDVRYTVRGQPVSSNPAGFRAALPAHPVVISWDGQVLTQLGASEDVPPGVWRG